MIGNILSAIGFGLVLVLGKILSIILIPILVLVDLITPMTYTYHDVGEAWVMQVSKTETYAQTGEKVTCNAEIELEVVEVAQTYCVVKMKLKSIDIPHADAIKFYIHDISSVMSDGIECERFKSNPIISSPTTYFEIPLSTDEYITLTCYYSPLKNSEGRGSLSVNFVNPEIQNDGVVSIIMELTPRIKK